MKILVATEPAAARQTGLRSKPCTRGKTIISPEKTPPPGDILAKFRCQINVMMIEMNLMEKNENAGDKDPTLTRAFANRDQFSHYTKD